MHTCMKTSSKLTWKWKATNQPDSLNLFLSNTDRLHGEWHWTWKLENSWNVHFIITRYQTRLGFVKVLYEYVAEVFISLMLGSICKVAIFHYSVVQIQVDVVLAFFNVLTRNHCIFFPYLYQDWPKLSYLSRACVWLAITKKWMAKGCQWLKVLDVSFEFITNFIKMQRKNMLSSTSEKYPADVSFTILKLSNGKTEDCQILLYSSIKCDSNTSQKTTAVTAIFNLFAINIFEKVCDFYYFANSSLDSIQWIRFCI